MVEAGKLMRILYQAAGGKSVLSARCFGLMGVFNAKSDSLHADIPRWLF
jgi:hypothetical protein